MNHDRSQNRQRDLEREVWQMLSSTLTFDPQQDSAPTGRDTAAITFDYMNDHPAEWVYRRRELDKVRDDLVQGVRVVLYGETGCGKTTICNALRSTDLTSGGPQMVIVFDLNSLAHVLRHLDKSKASQRISDEILSWLTEAIASSAFEEQVVSQFERIVPREAPAFADLRSRYRRQTSRWFHQEPDSVVESTLADFEDLKATYEADWAVFESSGSQEQNRFWMMALASCVFPVLCFDNVDPIGREARDAVGMLAQELALTSDYRAGIVVACRSEHRSTMQTALDTGTAEPIPVNAIPSGETKPGASEFERIIGKRLALLEDGADLPETVRLALQATPDEFQSALLSVKSKLTVVLQALNSVKEPNHQRDLLAWSLLRWTNGDIRSAILELLALVDNDRDISALQGPNRKRLEDRAVHSFYRHLCTGERDSAGSHLRECLEFFNAQNSESTGSHRPFYFLRLRLLSHLLHRRSEISVTALSVVELFESDFGVKRQQTLDALQWLSYREGLNSGYIRLENASGRVHALDLTEDLSEIAIKMLPSGVYFIRWLTKTVEYLYWNQLSAEHSNPVVRAGEGEVDLRGVGARAVDKVTAATQFAEGLLALFLQEHPYMDRSVTVTLRDKERLQKFRNAFGFHNGDWFIQQLGRSISAYASSSDVEYVVYQELDKTISSFVRRLNFVEKLTESP